MLRRIAGADDIAALRDLADVLEPVKDYARQKLATVAATAATPLNRLVDAARPESATARHFANLVDTFVAGEMKPGMDAEIRTWLNRWRDNYVNLQPIEGQSPLLEEVVPLSQDLSALGAAGLEALDYLDKGEPAPEAWRIEQLARIEQAEKPKAQLLLMIAPSIRKLVEASAGTAARGSAPRDSAR
jgi:hexosaminidase